MPGIIRSVSTTCTRWVRTISSAALAPSAVSTRSPSRWKIFSIEARFEGSSSTTSTVGASADAGFSYSGRGVGDNPSVI
jgi:hypothetical protein